jgi:hypothetical protein
MALVNATAVSFDSNDLATAVPGLTVLKTNAYQPGKRTLSNYGIARTNLNKVNSAFYTDRTLDVRVGITRTTRDLAEQSLDTLLGILQGQEKALIVSESSTRRQYTATMLDTPILVGGGAYMEVDLIFYLSDSFGYDLASTLLLQITNYTSSYKSDRLLFSGSANFQAPVITITFTAVGSATSKTVLIGNSGNGQQLTITRTWVAGDVLVINERATNPVTINGLPVAFTGSIPQWPPGFGFWSYSDNFTSRTINGQIGCNFRWV